MEEDLTECLYARRNELEEIIAYALSNMREKHSSRIEILQKRNSFQYYSVKNMADGRTKREYIPVKNRDYVRKIAQANYFSELVECAAAEKAAIDSLLGIQKNRNANNVFCSLHPGRKKLVSPVAVSDDEYAESWQRTKNEPRMPISVANDIVSDRGEPVRSKTEKIIADSLNKMKVPYKYEEPLRLGKHILYPDFTLLRKKTRKIVFWEHFGRMDDLDYLGRSIEKLSVYAKNNIVCGKNLIITIESSEHPLSTNLINSIIKSIS